MSKVLVVDDDRIICHMVKTVLQNQNVEVLEAQDGKDGLEKAKNFIPDVILLDILMPEMDGWEFTKNYRQLPDFMFIPIIFMTSLSSLHTRACVFRNGADDFMQKPFPTQELIFRVNKAIGYSKRIKEYFYSKLQQEQFEIYGLVDELGIASFLTFLENDKKTGLFILKDTIEGKKICRLNISEGLLVKAEIEGKIFDEYVDIIHEILTWTSGEYHFFKKVLSTEEYERQLEITPLILNAACRMDENKNSSSGQSQ
ncbi:response regulator [Candidatus Uabimicrobium sp. HlEnr_7]|uniref:response regulator n=1 Tax=Candidatus Uabimicrobium helgolandensis TaxID=3095367 RepID=UPI003556FE50